MEICRAIDAATDKRLQAKCKHAMFVIERTLTLYRFEEVAFSFNGGKDSTVLLHLLRAGYALRSKTSDEDQKEPQVRTIYFETPDAFPEIDAFTYKTAEEYNLQVEVLRQDFKSGLEALLKTKPVKAIFLGTRIGDPNAVGQEQFAPSTAGWPSFMRVNPILDWSYRDIWAFLLICKVPYCELYDHGYTSIGSIHDTVPNEALRIGSASDEKPAYKPAYLLRDGRLERAGRLKKSKTTPHLQYPNGVGIEDHLNVDALCAASIVSIGDELLRGELEDQAGTYLSKELFALGWTVTRRAVLPNDIDAIAEEVEQRAASSDVVIVTGGIGPFHCNVTLAGVAKAFGVRLAPDEEFEEFLRQRVADTFAGDENEMAKLPEGITELLHGSNLSTPVIKCRNVFLLAGPTMKELKVQFEHLSKTKEWLSAQRPFRLIKLRLNVPSIRLAKPLSRLAADYTDVTFGCCYEAEGDEEQSVISLVGKNSVHVEAAASALQSGAFVDSTTGTMCC